MASPKPPAMVEVTARLSRQAQLTDDLVTAARGQSAQIASGDGERLLQTLTRRQQIIDELIAVQIEVERLGAAIGTPAFGEQGTVEDVPRILQHIADNLAIVAELDERDREAIEAHLRTLSHERDTNKAARSAHEAYGRAVGGAAAPDSNTRFTDQRG